MPRLPRPGKDNDNWGSLLNDFLLASHSQDGNLKKDSVGSVALASNSVTSAHIASGAVSDTNLSKDLKTKIETATSGPKIWNGNDQPQDAKDGDLWLDTTSGIPVLQAKVDSSWLAVGAASATQPMAMAVLALPTNTSLVYRINCGGTVAVGDWLPDQYFTSGTASNWTKTVDTSGVDSPAPMKVYQKARYKQTFSYNLTSLSPGTTYFVRLHFNDSYWTAAGSRIFSVNSGGNTLLSNFDIIADAGGPNKATIKEFDLTANAQGVISINFTTSVDNASINAIEVYSYVAGSSSNLLTGKVFTSNVPDSTTETGNPITNMTDGNANSRWISQPTSPMNATVDMGASYSLSKVTIVWAADTIKNYQIQVSSDNTTWTTIASGVTNNTTKQSVDYTSFGATATGRYLRIVGTDRWNTAYGNSIWEVEAYGTPSTAPPPATTAPTNISATSTSSSVSLSWGAPTTLNGSLQGYNIYQGSTKLNSTPTMTTSYTVNGLNASTSYGFSVKAVTTNGEGPAASVNIQTKAPTTNTVNILQGKLFTSNVPDSTTETGNPITNMTDGNANSRWISQPTSPMNATVDMGGTYNLDKITVVWAADTIKNYKIEISTNNSTWSTLSTGVTDNTNKQSVDYTTFTSTATGRYLRITGTDRWNTSYGNSIWEVMAYGTLISSGPTGSVSGFTGSAQSTSSIKLDWTYSGSALSSFTLKRNGATVGTIGAADRTYTDSGLNAGTSYSYSLVGNFQAGGSTNAATVSVTTNTAPTSPGSKWLSGSSGTGTVNGSFAAWRGEAATYNRTWSDATTGDQQQMWAVDSFRQAGFSGILDVAPGGFKPGMNWNWQNAASGAYDDHWRTMARKLVEVYGTLKCMDISLFHECNGTWYDWPIKSGDAAYFRTAFKRMSDIFRYEMVTVGKKKIRIVLSLNSDNVGGIPIANYMPDLSSFDILGVDLYDFLMTRTESEWNNFTNSWKGGAPLGMNAWITYAQSIGKPISFPEWGINPDTGYSGSNRDNPLYIQKMYDAFKAIAPADPYNPGPGQLAGEAYYNDRPNKSQIFGQTSAPNAAAKYKSLVWGG